MKSGPSSAQSTRSGSGVDSAISRGDRTRDTGERGEFSEMDCSGITGFLFLVNSPGYVIAVDRLPHRKQRFSERNGLQRVAHNVGVSELRQQPRIACQNLRQGRSNGFCLLTQYGSTVLFLV